MKYRLNDLQIEPTDTMIRQVMLDEDVTWEEAYDMLMEHAPDMMDLGK